MGSVNREDFTKHEIEQYGNLLWAADEADLMLLRAIRKEDGKDVAVLAGRDGDCLHPLAVLVPAADFEPPTFLVFYEKRTGFFGWIGQKLIDLGRYIMIKEMSGFSIQRPEIGIGIQMRKVEET